MSDAMSRYSRSFLAAFILLAATLAGACEQPDKLGEQASALATRDEAQRQVDDCISRYQTEAERKQCIEEAGFSLFDDRGIETADRCVLGCLCVRAEGCPCCPSGSFGGWVFWPRSGPGVWTPSEPMSEDMVLEIDRACVGQVENGKAAITVETRTESRLASLIDFELAVPAAGVVAATVSDDGRYHDADAGDSIYGGVALVGEHVAAQTCFSFGCRLRCKVDWVFPGDEGWCPADELFGTGCLKLSECEFECGIGGVADALVQPAMNLFRLR